MEKIHRCDLDKPCVQFCNSKESHLCGTIIKDKKVKDNRLVLDSKIDNWGIERGISINGTPMAQAIKTLEETTELLDAINTNNRAELMDAVGDIYVTLRMQCLVNHISMERCIALAYDEIKDRTGYLRQDGTFVKDKVEVIDHPNQTYMEFDNE